MEVNNFKIDFLWMGSQRSVVVTVLLSPGGKGDLMAVLSSETERIDGASGKRLPSSV